MGYAFYFLGLPNLAKPGAGSRGFYPSAPGTMKLNSNLFIIHFFTGPINKTYPANNRHGFPRSAAELRRADFAGQDDVGVGLLVVEPVGGGETAANHVVRVQFGTAAG
jgi:hypothetical protein